MRFIFICYFIVICFSSYPQTGRKPSANYTQEKTDTKTKAPSLSIIKDSKDFNKLARVYNNGTIHEIPHILFMIDRSQSNKMYYINTPMYEYHLYFINDLLGQAYTAEDIANNYKDNKRRFIFGTISYQNHIKVYTYEFWDGDKINPELLYIAQKTIIESFNDTILFKTNSTAHEEVAKSLGINYISQDQLVKGYPYIALNLGNAKGKIRIFDSIEDIQDIDENTILVLKEVPISIPAVAGVITEKASTLLSHVNVLARGLKIPSIYIKDACAEMQKYEGKFVELKATSNDYKIKEIDEPPFIKSRQIKYSIKSNTKKSDLMPLNNIRANDQIYCGAKAANLGEIKAKIKNVVIPDGFSIPFAQYESFMILNKIREHLKEIESHPSFYEQIEFRRIELAKLRDRIELTEIDSAIVNSWIQQWSTQLDGKGVFVRSSSNAEDLKNFSGAGLFTTIPNVKSAEELEKAVKKVWASIYNFEAYESRRRAGIPDSLVMMSVFVQLAVDSDISGVMITKDPYDPIRWDITYIAAKRGIGIKVVEGKRIAEQVMYSDRTKAVQLITRSEEDSELKLDENGGIKEIPLKIQSRVMSDELVKNLAGYGRKIKQVFKEDMDIEWAVNGNQVIILQARPYK